MTKSIIVTKAEKDKFRVLVCYIQRGINFHDAIKANEEAVRLAEEEHITNVHLIDIPKA